ncbi:DMT family transporter [Haloarculaceae archaeon H-GB2-1]|nr:DMT family transporter [Haloarculaceae archaeon H-GB1-1]MEA5406613.1 DMT family transporter [Haloarculaceae archaeon H-GB2-1]
MDSGRSTDVDAAAAGPLLAASLWGGMYVVSKWGFASIPPVTLAFLRVVLGAATLAVVVRATRPRRSFTRAEWRRFLALAVLVVLTLVPQFVGTDLTTASQGALLTVLTPVFTFAFGVALGEAVTRRKVGGMALAGLGTVVVLLGQYDLAALAGGTGVGVGLLLVASAAWAGFTVVGKPLVRRYSALEAATYATILAVPMTALLVPVEFALGASLSAASTSIPVVGAVVYLGVGSTALAWYAWYKGMESVGASTIAVFFFVQPVVGTLLSAALLGETVTAGFLAGGATMAAGVFLVSTAPADA